jgi:hypothetical protein
MEAVDRYIDKIARLHRYSAGTASKSTYYTLAQTTNKYCVECRCRSTDHVTQNETMEQQ